ncbi:uncharacterized protein LOC135207901 isoform X2 [Macrobrachium nipponense]|uniref:uncharacterized protein LOC135207901 isoform X2 n=1 Tax=Macrobrachium nipponense TaxID=159736 RepID=UPI0030C7FCA0
MINDELPDIRHENIPAFIEKMDNLCMIGEKARGQANREKFNRYKVLALGYTAVIMFCYYKEEYEREYGELQDLTETELDQDFEENKLEDIKEKARKQARIGLLRALEKFSWALYICDEPCEWLMEPYLHALKIVHGNKDALEALESYVQKNSSHLPAHKLAYQFTRLCPEAGAFQQKELEEIIKLCPDDPLVITYAEDLLDKGGDVETLIKIINMLMDMIEFKEWRWDIRPWKILCRAVRNSHVKSIDSSSQESGRIKDELQKISKERTPLWKAYVWIFPEFSKISVDQAEILFYSTYTAFVLQYDEKFTKLMEKVFVYYGYQELAEDLKNAKQCSGRQQNSFLKNFSAYKNSHRLPYSTEDMFGNMKIQKNDNNEKDCHTWLNCNLGKNNRSNLGSVSSVECQDIRFNDADFLTSTQVSVSSHGSPLAESIGMCKSPKLNGTFQDSYSEFGAEIPCGQMDPVLQKVDIETGGCDDNDDICTKSEGCVSPDLDSMEEGSSRDDEYSDGENVIGPSQTTDLSFEPKTLSTSFSKPKRDLSDVKVGNPNSEADIGSQVSLTKGKCWSDQEKNLNTPRCDLPKQRRFLEYDVDDLPFPLFQSQMIDSTKVKECSDNGQVLIEDAIPKRKEVTNVEEVITETSRAPRQESKRLSNYGMDDLPNANTTTFSFNQANETSIQNENRGIISGHKDKDGNCENDKDSNSLKNKSFSPTKILKNYVKTEKLITPKSSAKKYETSSDIDDDLPLSVLEEIYDKMKIKKNHRTSIEKHLETSIYEIDDLPFPDFESQAQLEEVEAEIAFEDYSKQEVNIKSPKKPIDNSDEQVGLSTMKNQVTYQSSKKQQKSGLPYKLEDLPFPKYETYEFDDLPFPVFESQSVLEEAGSAEKETSKKKIGELLCHFDDESQLIENINSSSKTKTSTPFEDLNNGTNKSKQFVRDDKHERSSDFMKIKDVKPGEESKPFCKEASNGKKRKRSKFQESSRKKVRLENVAHPVEPLGKISAETGGIKIKQEKIDDYDDFLCIPRYIQSDGGRGIIINEVQTLDDSFVSDRNTVDGATYSELKEGLSYVSQDFIGNVYSDSVMVKKGMKTHVISDSTPVGNESTAIKKDVEKKKKRKQVNVDNSDISSPTCMVEIYKKKDFDSKLTQQEAEQSKNLDSTNFSVLESNSVKRKSPVSVNIAKFRHNKTKFTPRGSSKFVNRCSKIKLQFSSGSGHNSPTKEFLKTEIMTTSQKNVLYFAGNNMHVSEDIKNKLKNKNAKNIMATVRCKNIVEVLESSGIKKTSSHTNLDSSSVLDKKKRKKEPGKNVVNVKKKLKKSKKINPKKEITEKVSIGISLGETMNLQSEALDNPLCTKKKKKERKHIGMDNTSDISKPIPSVEIDMKRGFHSKLTPQEVKQSNTVTMTQNFSLLENSSIKTRRPAFKCKKKSIQEKKKFIHEDSRKCLDTHKKFKSHFSNGIDFNACKIESRTEILDMPCQKSFEYSAGNNIHVGKDIESKCKKEKAKKDIIKSKCKKEKANNITKTVVCYDTGVLESSGTKTTPSHTNLYKKGDICNSNPIKKKRREEPGVSIGGVKKVKTKNKRRKPSLKKNKGVNTKHKMKEIPDDFVTMQCQVNIKKKKKPKRETESEVTEKVSIGVSPKKL